MSWTDRAACVNSDVDFFPDLSDRAGIARAKAVCRSCPVFAECDADAESRRERFGVWAGKARGGDTRCGTLLGYQRGCRCDLCHDVKSENHRRYRAKLIATLRDDPHDPRHGTNGYNVGCRCETCKEASRQLWIQRKQARVAS